MRIAHEILHEVITKGKKKLLHVDMVRTIGENTTIGGMIMMIQIKMVSFGI
jgi:hypothetical protein